MTSVIPWRIKKGRPSAIPGCQNVKELSELSEDKEKCEEGSYCYYYRCKKCWPYLILDYFNLQHEEKLVIIPEISNLQPKTKGLFDDDDYGYLGEVLEFYRNYLSRVDDVLGVAINGWDNELAESVFDFVGDTFKNTKNGSSRNFEIDWIILNGDSVTVVEVGMRGKTEIREGKENCIMNEEKGIQGVIADKFKQIVKNRTIVEHLLEATGNQHIQVNYLAFFPNISIASVQAYLDKMQQIAGKKGRQSSINELVASKKNIQFGIITTECIAPKCVHLYLGQGKLDKRTELANTLRIQSQGWTENYRYLTSLLAASWQMPPKSKSIKSTNGSLSREIKETRMTVGWEQRKGLKFPKDLILGQEQLEVMKGAQNFNSHDDARITFLIGEAGCGKTTTLLALLFKYAGKHVSEKRLRNVVFFVPEGKTEFRKYVKQFIEDHCNGEWVQLIPLHCMQSECLSPEKIYLVDEFYGSSQDLLNSVRHANCTFYVASISVKSGFVSFAIRDKNILRNFLFRRVYRSPEALSRISSKLRRLMDRDGDDDAHLNIPWAMSFFNGAPTSLRNPIEVTAFTDTVLPILENLSLDSKRSLLVTLECDQQIVSEIDQKFLVATKYHLTHQTKCVEDIPFTGSEFDNVAIFLAENVEWSSELVLALLHSAISRATSKVFIVCHQRDRDLVTSMLSLKENNDVIFERLRYSSDVNPGNLDEMRDPKDRLELLKRLIVTKNESKFKSLKLSYDESKLTNGERDLIKWTGLLGKPLLSEDFHLVIDAFNTLDRISSMNFSRISSLRSYLNVFPNCDVQIPESFKKSPFELSDTLQPIALLIKLSSHKCETDGKIDWVSYLQDIISKNREETLPLLELFDIKKLEKIDRFLNKTLNFVVQNAEELTFHPKTVYKAWCFSFEDPWTKFIEKDRSGTTFIHHLALRSGPKLMLDVMRHLPRSINLSDDIFLDNCLQNPLMLSVVNSQVFDLIVDREKTYGDMEKLLNLKDIFGWSCLRWACRIGNLTVIKKLLFLRVDWTNDLDPEGRTVLHALSAFGHAHIVEYFIKLDSKHQEPFKFTKRTDNFGMTCLHRACFFGQTQVVKVILKAVPELNFELFMGINCLTIALKSIFEEREKLKSLLKDKLHIQDLDVKKMNILDTCWKTIHQLNFYGFVDWEEKAKIIRNKYLQNIPVMITVALFDLP